MVNDIIKDDEEQSKGSSRTGNARDENNSDFPGYPHYPSSDDITHPSNGVKKVDADLENMNRSVPGSGLEGGISERLDSGNTGESEEDDLLIVPGTEADVTKEDLLILGPRDEDMDMGDDEQLRGKLPTVGAAEDAMDVPGSELDDADESIGEEDEENNYYSLGGDNKENLEEDNQQ